MKSSDKIKRVELLLDDYYKQTPNGKIVEYYMLNFDFEVLANMYGLDYDMVYYLETFMYYKGFSYHKLMKLAKKYRLTRKVNKLTKFLLEHKRYTARLRRIAKINKIFTEYGINHKESFNNRKGLKIKPEYEKFFWTNLERLVKLYSLYIVVANELNFKELTKPHIALYDKLKGGEI